MQKIHAVSIAAGVVLATLMIACASVHESAQLPPASAIQPAAYRPGTDGVRDGAADGAAPAADGLLQQPQSPIGIDYSPEARCADGEPQSHLVQRPAACDPPLDRDERSCGNTLAGCPGRCLKCYSDDLGFIKRDLHVNTITVYYPNYYVLKAAQRLRMKVIVGVLNDSVLGLASPASQTNCTYAGTPFPLCGSRYADALLDGVCLDQVGGDPLKPCSSRCSFHSNPAKDCVNGDCSCRSDSECPGSANKCEAGMRLAPLDNPATGEFLHDGTVIGIQLGNEFFEACDIVQIPGLNQPCCSHSTRTGRCNSWVVTREVISAAAQTLRNALNRHGDGRVKISVALVKRQGRKFCQNGKPPPGVDLISAHPYCDFVAEMPAAWTTLSGAQCWQQARYEDLPVDQKACGVEHTYIGETGYNSGCPLGGNNEEVLLKAEREFVDSMIADEPLCKGQPNPTAPFPNSLFEFSDDCPPGGCLAGCGDPRECSYECCCKHNCSAGSVCGPNCPKCLGNGYFGLFHTPGYATVGFPLEPKFNPTPSLLCPPASKP